MRVGRDVISNPPEVEEEPGGSRSPVGGRALLLPPGSSYLQGCDAGNGFCARGIHLGLGDPVLGLFVHGHVSKSLGGLNGDALLLLQVFTALAAAAALGATTQQTAGTAAEPPAAAGGRADEFVPGLQRVHPRRQEVPVLELVGQDAWAVGLQEPEDHHQEDHKDDGRPHTHQHWPADQREAKHSQRDQEGEDDQVEDGKPAVLS